MSNQTVSAYTIARELLSANIDLPSDQLLARLKSRGATQPDDILRRVINNTRSEMRGRAKQQKPAAGKKAPSPYTITRELLTADPTLSNEAIFARIKARGVSKSDATIRDAIRRTRSDMAASGPKPAPTAARETTEPKAPAPAPAAEPKVEAVAPDEAALFAALGQVNKTAQLCGGVAKARAIADAIRACGGIDAFLRRLDLVAEILGSETEL